MPLVQQQSAFWTDIKTLSDHKGTQRLQVFEESSPHFPLPIWENPWRVWEQSDPSKFSSFRK